MLHRAEQIRRFVAAGLVALLVGAVPRPVDAGSLPHQGDHSAAVVLLQKLLVGAGVHVVGGADGVFGPGTTRAIAAFQTAKGLGASGALDDATAVALGLLPPLPVVRVGSTGADVRTVQVALLTVGIRIRGGTDGVFGTATAAAVASFQTGRHLVATGTVDAYTLAVLLAAGRAVAPVPRPYALASFPIAANCGFADTWGAPRPGGRQHEGVDLFARAGSPVLAVEPGVVSRRLPDRRGSLGGNQIWVTTSDGTRFFYGHLQAFANGMIPGVHVVPGQVIGAVGKTGLASVAHLHFEWHPLGGKAANPYVMLRLTANCATTRGQK